MFWMLLLSFAMANDEVITLKKGQKAPWDGTLLSPSAAAKLLATGESELAKCKAKAEKDIAILEAELTLKLKSKEAEFAACTFKATKMEEIYLDQIKYLEKRSVSPAWEKPVLFAGGVITGAGLIALSAWTLNKIGNQNVSQ